MTSELVTVGPMAPIKEATDLLAFHGISGVLVCDDERLLGVVSEADIISRFGSDVSDIMTREVVTVPETMPIRDVADLLVRRGIKRAPVMRDGRVVGLISRADLVRWLAAQ
jgi:CBS domain-containing protein